MVKNRHYFYVLQCKDGSFYAGYTNNIEERIRKHNAGKGAKYTRAKRPVTLLHFEEYETKTEAMQAEYRFKQLKRSEKEKVVGMEGKENEATEEL